MYAIRSYYASPFRPASRLGAKPLDHERRPFGFVTARRALFPFARGRRTGARYGLFVRFEVVEEVGQLSGQVSVSAPIPETRGAEFSGVQFLLVLALHRDRQDRLSEGEGFGDSYNFV